jgi:hypothetical protein
MIDQLKELEMAGETEIFLGNLAKYHYFIN